MNLKSRYAVVCIFAFTVIAILLLPFDRRQSTSKRGLDCNLLMKEMYSLPDMQEDLIVVNSRDIQNKSFEQLQLEKFRRVIRKVNENNNLKVSALVQKEDRNLGSKDWIFDCVTWNIIEKKLQEDSHCNISAIDINHGLKANFSNSLSHKMQSSKNSSTKTNESLYSLNMMAAVHVILTKVKHMLKQDTISVLEIFCGKLTWMEEILKIRSDIRYTGIDTDEKIIHKNRLKYTTTLPLSSFYVFDITEKVVWDKFDIIFMFNMIPLFSQDQLLNVLHHIDKSDSTYLLIGENPYIPVTAEHQLENLLHKPLAIHQPTCIRKINKVKFLMLWSLPIKKCDRLK